MINKFDKAMFKTAMVWAELSSCKRRKVGAVISYNNRIISNGYNGTIAGQSNECEREALICNACNTELEGEWKEGERHCYSGEVVKKLITNDLTLHAEQNAIMDAAKQGRGLDGATIYITTSPCKNCAKLIAQSGIRKVLYLDEYKDLEGVKFLRDLNIEVIKYSFNNEVDHVVEALCNGSIEQWSEESKNKIFGDK